MWISGAVKRVDGAAQAGAGVWFGDADPKNTEVRLPSSAGQTVTNAEVIAALTGIRLVSPRTELKIVSCRPFVQKAMTQKLSQWEDRGWIGVPDSSPLKALASELKKRPGSTRFETQGLEKAGQPGNSGASALARNACHKQTADEVNLRVATGQQLEGAKLSTMTQAIAYAGVKCRRKEVDRKATNDMVKHVQTAIKQEYGWLPSPARIWKSVRHKDFTRQIRNFLWKSLHNAHRVGNYWKHIPECEDRGICQYCNECEDLEHIFLKCRRPGQAEIWDLAKSLWLKKHLSWPSLSLRLVLGCGLAVVKDDEGRHLPGASRLLRILISESLFLIWKVRNDCVIGNEGTPPTVTEIHNKWLYNINQRLDFECTMTNQKKYGKASSLKPLLVLQTWSSTLKGEASLPENWLQVAPRVLVGIEPRRHLQPPAALPQGRRGRNR
ncbi:hypothetical protein B0H12DRAFT_1025902 [Mycena haematopus]|nr:hypothetical protein B0H12DRAFT_1025902 [Mycena haematopus]